MTFMKITFYVLGLLLLTACGNGTSNTDDKKTDSSVADTADQPKDSAKIHSTFLPKLITDSIINLELPQNGDTLKVRMLKNTSPISCNISLPKTGNLYGTITTPTNKDNIRFNQMIMPDSSANGPFDRTIQYDIKKTGNYKLIIASNLMAENPYTGEFELSLVVK